MDLPARFAIPDSTKSDQWWKVADFVGLWFQVGSLSHVNWARMAEWKVVLCG